MKKSFASKSSLLHLGLGLQLSHFCPFFLIDSNWVWFGQSFSFLYFFVYLNFFNVPINLGDKGQRIKLSMIWIPSHPNLNVNTCPIQNQTSKSDSRIQLILSIFDEFQTLSIENPIKTLKMCSLKNFDNSIRIFEINQKPSKKTKSIKQGLYWYIFNIFWINLGSFDWFRCFPEPMYLIYLWWCEIWLRIHIESPISRLRVDAIA